MLQLAHETTNLNSLLRYLHTYAASLSELNFLFLHTIVKKPAYTTFVTSHNRK